MGTAQLSFAEERWGATGSDVTGSDVSHMTKKWRHRKSRDFSPVLFLPYFPVFFFLYLFLTSFSRTFLPYFFCATFVPYFFSSCFFFPTFFPYFFLRIFLPYLFISVLFSFFFPYFFYIFFPYFFSRTFSYFFSYFFNKDSSTFFPVFFFLYFFFPSYFSVLFQKSRRLKSNVLKYQWVVFLVHVVISQFMPINNYHWLSIKTQTQKSLKSNVRATTSVCSAFNPNTRYSCQIYQTWRTWYQRISFIT